MKTGFHFKTLFLKWKVVSVDERVCMILLFLCSEETDDRNPKEYF